MDIEMKLKPIGLFHTVFKEKFGIPRQSGIAKEADGLISLNLDNASEMIEGLEGFSHIWVLFYFHENSNKSEISKIKPPRLGGKKIGVLATRSPHRPNPIGLSLVKVENIDGKNIFVSGVDVLTETPVIDIKPYIRDYDSVSESFAGWTEEVEDASYGVEFSRVALHQADSYFHDKNEKDRFLSLIKSVVEKDPRPIAYRNKKHQGFLHGMSLGNQNVQFSFDGERFNVENIEPR